MAMIRKVGFLDETAAKELVKKPVEAYVNWEQTVVNDLYRITNGHPFLMQNLCQELILDMNQRGEGHFIFTGHLQKVVDEMVKSLSGSLNYLWTNCTPFEKIILSILANVSMPEVSPDGVRNWLGVQLPEITSSDLFGNIPERLAGEALEETRENARRLRLYEPSAQDVYGGLLEAVNQLIERGLVAYDGHCYRQTIPISAFWIFCQRKWQDVSRLPFSSE